MLTLGVPQKSAATEGIEAEGKEASFALSGSENVESTISITVIGASGDLAKKKIFPALFALFYEDFLPEVLFLDISTMLMFS